MMRPFLYSWQPIAGNSGSPPGQTLRFPVRSIWEMHPTSHARQLEWAGRPAIAAATTNPFELLAPSVLVSLRIGNLAFARLAGMQGSIIVPPGAGVSLSLASPLYMPASLVDPANNVNFAWAGGQLVAACNEALAGAVDHCSLSVPLMSDNFQNGKQYVAIPGAWLEGYSSYQLNTANGCKATVLRHRVPVAHSGSPASSTVAPVSDAGDIDAALMMGWGVEVESCSGYPMGGSTVAAVFGSKLCFYAGNLSFW